jgi:aryl-alcohol dehydrogenase-like predicted oxidoreductase
VDTVRLGRTGLEVSVAGLGCGGHSRLGQSSGASEAHSVAVVQRALDLGVTFVDTARAYGTEEIVGKGVAGRRDEVVLSTKVMPLASGGEPLPAAGLRSSVEKSLRRLATDRIDVLHLHGVGVAQVEHCRDELVPEMLALRDEGKIRFLGATEAFVTDPGHAALPRVLTDDWADVVMVGLSLLNQSARDRVLPLAVERDVGVLVMFAVRRALSRPEALREVLEALVASQALDAGILEGDDPLAFLVEEGAAASLADAAYRYCRHEPGVHVVLTGTGDVAHLEQNVRSISAGPLAPEHLARIAALFGHLDSVSGN